MATETHAEWIAARLVASGIDAVCVGSQQDDRNFGNAEAIFRADSLLLRFLRDRGQDFLDVGLVEMPTQFHQFHVVEVAMGWKTLDQVLARREPENLIAVIECVKANFNALTRAFDVSHRHKTLASLAKAQTAYGKAMVAKFKR